MAAGARKLFLCCLNVQEGRSPLILSLLTRACSTTLIKLFSDPVFNRSNFTLCGEEADILNDVTSVAGVALKTINIEKISSKFDTSHHHIGALDLIPIHPYNNSTLPEAGDLACKVAINLNNLSIPTLLYGHAHRDLLTLVTVRKRTKFFNRGQTLKGVDNTIPQAILHNNNPGDVAELAKPHLTMGVSVVGATNYVLSYNIVLDTTDIAVANSIVREVRSRHVQAMGYVNRFNGSDVTEVACNMLHTDIEGCEAVRGKVEKLASERGTKVIHSYSTNPQLKDIPRMLEENSLLY